MSNILDNFTICEIIPKNQKINIDTVFIFDDRLGYNILFLTKDDQVFGFGSNCYGCMGLGYGGVINEPKLISELCGKNLVEFYNGLNFVLAKSQNNLYYGWGDNSWGQLGRGYASPEKQYLIPAEIAFFQIGDIDQISCGKFHTLALMNNNKLYGWGDNRVGQIGCGDSELKLSSKPIELETFSECPVLRVYCSYNRSFALLSDGKVYSWGENMWRELGHELEQNESVYYPKLINLLNVVDVCPSHRNTYFLTKQGFIYFCGRDESEATLQSENERYQYIPRLLTKNIQFEELHSIPCYQRYSAVSTAFKNNIVYEIFGNKIETTKYNNFFQYYMREYQMTYKNIIIDGDSNYSIMQHKKYNLGDVSDSGVGCHVNNSLSNNSDIKTGDNSNIASSINSNGGIYHDKHEEICLLGTGGFGKVMKVRDLLDKQEYAIKIIDAQGVNNKELKNVRKELEIMAKLNCDYVVSYKTSWVDNNTIYIKMEYCSDNLKNIIDGKAHAFSRRQNKPMIAIEYFFSCELFRELLESVKYLHESDPPIIHRDIKPSNVLITYNNRNGRFLKLCDFGLATVHESEYMMHTQELGTRKYIAFEVSQSTQYDTRADVYSVGIIAQELFDFDINFSETHSRFENILREKFKVLESMIISMLHNLYRQRPNCDCVLNHADEFTFNKISVKGTQNFDSTMKRLKEMSNPFYYNFLSKKLA